jgi:hypothetical protein
MQKRNPQVEFQKWAQEDEWIDYKFEPAPLPKAEHYNRTKFTEVVKTVWKKQVIGNLP